ncbi:cytochrome c oxidase assembly protein PET191-domain-containing protein [Epithele typhae]|uniref:cytochrome c oxidase assembly protein PET191-domain-containing protein n=1 Tax=Epithele typhae TaxID=378194 RepID=UPI0020083606|nr:cytochrome c oxidase assembly protein PET191-domain-containing protein [Epithele typhae]KAH9943113.1 cytochrome c oxidase assembly protein PET191-domain-containing protein [Epithele typhae]
MSSSCSHLLAALKECVLYSDCVMKQGHLPSDCLRNHTDELPDACKSLRMATFECKRGMLDMRKRFRGNNIDIPASSPKPREQPSPESG